MSTPGRSRLAFLLFALGCLLAFSFLALLLLAPCFDDPDDPLPQGWRRVLAIAARDGVFRRTTCASALGLFVSAWVFFRPGRRASVEAIPPPSRPRSPSVPGA